MPDQIRVLHVDDDSGVTDLAATYLEREDDRFDVVTANSPTAGLSILADNQIDCVVSDYNMPEMDGITFLETIRPDYPDLPFILYTGQGSEEVASRAISAGITDYMQKEVGTDQYLVLAQRVRNAVTRRRAREQAQQAHERTRTILNASPDAILVTVDTDLAYANPAAVELFNATAESDLLDHPLLDLVASEDRPVVEDALESIRVDDDILTRARYTAQTLDGQPTPVDLSARTITWDGQPGVIAILRDLSEWDALTAKLEDERAFIQEAIDALEDLFIIIGPDGEPLRWNDRLPLVTGYTDADIAEMRPSDFFPQDEQDRVRTAIEQAVTTGRVTIETEILTHTDERIPYEFIGRRLTDSDGELIGIAGIGRDITTRKERERDLEQSNRLLSTLFETLPVGVTVLDAEGRITRANRRAENVLGLTESEITDRMYNDPKWEIVDEDGDPIPDENLPFARVRETGDPVFDYEHGIRWPDGSERWLSINAAPLTPDIDGSEEVVTVITDITDQRDYERTIEAQNERLEKFASIVSHDLRNPLTVAAGQLELAHEEWEGESEGDDMDESEHLTAIGEALERMETLIEDMLTLARQGESVTDIESVALSDLVENCWLTVETGAATLTTETDLRIRADRSRLQQLVENLIRNAVEHGGADVTVRVGELPDASGFYIEDDGPGIPDGKREQIFEVGYTTTGEGTGFGLNIVKEIVEAHGWEITVTEGRDGGARFEITGVETE